MRVMAVRRPVARTCSNWWMYLTDTGAEGWSRSTPRRELHGHRRASRSVSGPNAYPRCSAWRARDVCVPWARRGRDPPGERVGWVYAPGSYAEQ